jgi:hypothetical protein
MTNYELLNTIIEDADHIKSTEYNIRYLTLATVAGIFESEIYTAIRDIDSGGFGFAFERISASTTLDHEIKTQLFIIALRSAQMPILFKSDRDTKYFLMQAGAEHISAFIDANLECLVTNCRSFKGFESDEACEYFLKTLSKWFLNKDITDIEISQLYEYNIFNSMIAIFQVKDVSVLDTSNFINKLSSASDTEFNGIFFGKVFDRILGDKAYVYDARITKDYALHVSYLLRDRDYVSRITQISEPAHGIDGSKGCFCIEKKFNNAADLEAFITYIDENDAIKNKGSIISYSTATILGISVDRNSITYEGATYNKPDYTVNINRDSVKRTFNAILFKAIDNLIC